nr:hypothetical protein GCM10020185_15920 [Pseudomonas brassicacearum subsp. brassicacearum]
MPLLTAHVARWPVIHYAPWNTNKPPWRHRPSRIRATRKKAVPLAVSAWVVKGRTARQAADQILAKAAEFEANLLALRELRLKAKTQIRAHMAKGKADLASQAADDVLATIRALPLHA